MARRERAEMIWQVERKNCFQHLKLPGRAWHTPFNKVYGKAGNINIPRRLVASQMYSFYMHLTVCDAAAFAFSINIPILDMCHLLWCLNFISLELLKHSVGSCQIGADILYGACWMLHINRQAISTTSPLIGDSKRTDTDTRRPLSSFLSLPLKQLLPPWNQFILELQCVFSHKSADILSILVLLSYWPSLRPRTNRRGQKGFI